MRYLLLIFVFLSACATDSKNFRKPASPKASGPSINYERIFQKAREVLKEQSKPKIAESDLVEKLAANSDLLEKSREDLLREIDQEGKSQSDPTKHVRLIPFKDQPGYENLEIFVNHPYYLTDNLVPASDLIAVWRSFIRKAKKQIILNVFDFDLIEVADELATQARSGLSVRVGIDKNVIKERAQVAKVRDLLVQAGVQVTEVNSVALNHQKMTAIDWENPESAAVLFSSGNLTQSCLHPKGDLADLPDSRRPSYSVPNANHLITLKSWLLANIVQNELTKTIDPNFLYRGKKDYPLNGSYQVTGPNVDPMTFDPYPENSVIITFSPNGAYGGINRNLISHFIKKTEGPIRMIQFAFSSKEVATALVERAQKDFQTRGYFDFESVGDTPFAMQDWSQFLYLSGLDQTKKGSKKTYQVSNNNPLVRSINPAQLQSLRNQIRIAPFAYKNHSYSHMGITRKLNAKIHHKVLAAGPYVILGTSFNFSQGAEQNNEQILVFRDPKLVQVVHGMTRWLSQASPRSVYQEALRRNSFQQQAELDETDESEGLAAE